MRPSWFATAILLLVFAVSNSSAQCPDVTQWVVNGQADAGLVNGANVTIAVVGTSLQAGDSMIDTAGTEWAAIPNATYSFTVQNVSSAPPATGTASNPLIIFEVGPAADFASGGQCEGGIMCTLPPQLDGNGNVTNVTIEMNPNNTTNNTFFQEAFDHELGHAAFGLNDCENCSEGDTIMATPATDPTDNGPTTCDWTYLYRNSGGAYGSSASGGGGGGGFGLCPPGYRPLQDEGCNPSPILIDVAAEGFHLTSAAAGVKFDIAGDGVPVQLAWTDPRFHNAFLALPGADGVVHDGRQLFGNFTSQPASAHPNGFIALAEYDKATRGGNGDGVIDARDQVFASLRLWIDANHDGVCQPGELHPLPELGVHSLALNYVESRRRDRFANQFRYKARVDSDGQSGRWAYDVFFVFQ